MQTIMLLWNTHPAIAVALAMQVVGSVLAVYLGVRKGNHNEAP